MIIYYSRLESPAVEIEQNVIHFPYYQIHFYSFLYKYKQIVRASQNQV